MKIHIHINIIIIIISLCYVYITNTNHHFIWETEEESYYCLLLKTFSNHKIHKNKIKYKFLGGKISFEFSTFKSLKGMLIE